MHGLGVRGRDAARGEVRGQAPEGWPLCPAGLPVGSWGTVFSEEMWMQPSAGMGEVKGVLLNQ